MYVYVFRNQEMAESRIVTTSFPIKEKELLEHLVNSTFTGLGEWRLFEALVS